MLMSLWQKLKEQEVVDFRLLLAIPILLVIGVGVYAYSSRSDANGVSSGRSAPGLGEHVFYCHFDQTEVIAGGQTTWDLEKEGNAIISRGGSIPTRVRCTQCNRMSCFEHDRETDKAIEVDESWDLSESAQGDGGNPRDARGRGAQ